MLGRRTAFSRLGWRIYLDHAAVGPLPDAARDALVAAADAQATEGLAAMMGLAAAADQARTRFAALVGATPEAVALTGNTTDGVLLVAHGLAWRPGDRVLLFRGEFPTNTTPWQVAAELYGVEVVWLPVDTLATDDGLDAIEAVLREGVRLVAVSAVQFQTGLRAPLAALAERAHARGAELFVDAIQAVGAVPVDLARDGIDYLTSGGQKWLMGPAGTGLFTTSPDRLAALLPRAASWLSHDAPFRFLDGVAGRLTYDQPLVSSHARVEGGTRNFAGHAALAASLALHLEVGVDATFAHVQAWHDAAEPALTALGFTSERSADPARRSGILALRPPNGVALPALAPAIRAHGVSVSTPDGRLRLSPSWPNALDEVPATVDAIAAAVRAVR